MTKDMFIPNLFDMPKRPGFPRGRTITGTVSKKTLRSMVTALESVGLVVRHVERQYTCHVSGEELLNARPGNRGTYLVRYAENVTKLVEKQK